jgi:hypothetical protein
MPANTPRPTAEFCAELADPANAEIRFFGGVTLRPRPDPTRFGPCTTTLGLLDKLDTALVPLQPILRILDLLATGIQILLLIPACITNPFKIPSLLRAIPGLVAKLNDILSMIPVLPQGVVAFVAFVRDAAYLAAMSLSCAVEQLQAIQRQIEEIASMLARASEVRDTTIRTQLEELAGCAQSNVEQQMSGVLASLEVVARVLCTVRSVLLLIPGGRPIARSLQFPDVRSPDSIEDAIVALEGIRDALLAVVDVIEALAGGIVLPVSDAPFVCPVDDIAETEPVSEPPSEPSITAITDVAEPPTVYFFGGIGLIPLASAVPGTYRVAIRGANFLAGSFEHDDLPTSVVYFGADQIPEADVSRSSSSVLIVGLSEELRQNPAIYQVSVTNIGAGVGAPFSGLDGADANVVVSDQAQVEVG